MRFLLLVFVFIPLIEILLFIHVGQWLGALPTLGLVLISAVLGMSLLRRQGFATLLRASRKMEQGGLPTEEIVEGILLAIGGILFLIPGFFTDVAGFLCLIPFTRKFLAGRLIRKGLFLAPGIMGGHYASATFYSSASGSRVDDVIEGEFNRDDRERLR